MTYSRDMPRAKLKCGRCKVYICTPFDDLMIKVKQIIEPSWKIKEYPNNHIELNVLDFEDFILKFVSDQSLIVKEWSDIYILPFYPKETVAFTNFFKIKTLANWIGLIKSKDLIYIIENSTITTVFQPIILLKDYSIYGYELLSRGIKNDESIMSPNEMFKLAKESDLTFNLDRLAKETCIKNAAARNIKQKLFINVLPSAIYDPNLCLKTTTELILDYDMNPKNITFEVVETDEITDIDHLKNILNFYRKQGFNIALDDVGSGYSSLNNLAILHPDYIKIDMGLIRNIDKCPLKQSIFKALVSMSKGMNIIVLAEGVESKAELDYVKTHGVDLVQGYYFGKPSKEPLTSVTLV